MATTSTNQSDTPNITQPATQATPPELLGLGSWDIILNMLTVVIVFTDRPLLQQSSFLLGIAIGNFTQGLYLFSIGIYRLTYSSQLNDPTTANLCAQLVFPAFLPLGLVIQGCFLVLAGLERFLAINAYRWFWKHWHVKQPWLVSLAGYAVCIVIVGIGLALISYGQPLTTTWTCPSNGVFGSAYIVCCALFTSIGGAISAMLTVITLMTGLHHIRKLPLLSGDAGRLRKQIHLTKSTLLVAVSDLCLVAIPFLLTFLPLINVNVPAIKGPIVFYLNSANSTLNFIAFVMFNRNFRLSTLNLLKLKKMKAIIDSVFGRSKNQIHPM